jgi:hypothetical protein
VRVCFSFFFFTFIPPTEKSIRFLVDLKPNQKNSSLIFQIDRLFTPFKKSILGTFHSWLVCTCIYKVIFINVYITRFDTFSVNRGHQPAHSRNYFIFSNNK